MNSAIVTGANGFVGSAVVRELLTNGISVCALVHNNHRDNLPGNENLQVVSSLDDVQGEYEVFYHFAWIGSAGAARADTKLQLENAQMTVDMMRTAKALGCSRFLCAGSIMEHETMAAAYTDGNRPGMGYIYGAGKLAAHALCMSVAADIGIDLVWPEITNAYGPGEKSQRLLNMTIRKCLVGESPVFTAGTQNYDFVFIDDVARAFRMIGEKGKPFTEYLIGSSTARPLREFLLTMKEAIAPDIEFKFGDIPFTGINLPLSEFDTSKTERDTGFKAEIDFAEGCRRTMKWMIDNGSEI